MMNREALQIDTENFLQSTHLNNKIDVVQEILARLEGVLKIVSGKREQLEALHKSSQVLNVDHTIKLEKALLLTSQLTKLVGDTLNQYCALDNILRTVEENQQIQENVLTVFPDLSRLDEVIAYFQKDRVNEWNAIKQKVQEFNWEANRNNGVPVVSRLFQVKLTPAGSPSQTNNVLTIHNVPESRSSGKRPLTDVTSDPPEKFLKLSCSKHGQEVVTIVDFGMSEGQRYLNQTYNRNQLTGDCVPGSTLPQNYISRNTMQNDASIHPDISSSLLNVNSSNAQSHYHGLPNLSYPSINYQCTRVNAYYNKSYESSNVASNSQSRPSYSSSNSVAGPYNSQINQACCSSNTDSMEHHSQIQLNHSNNGAESASFTSSYSATQYSQPNISIQHNLIQNSSYQSNSSYFNQFTHNNIRRDVRPMPDTETPCWSTNTGMVSNPINPCRTQTTSLLTRLLESRATSAENSGRNNENNNILRPSVIQRSPLKLPTPESSKNTSCISNGSLYNEIQDFMEDTVSTTDCNKDTEMRVGDVPQDVTSVTAKEPESFEKYLKKTLVEGMEHLGLSNPKPMQIEAIKVLLEKKDLIFRCNRSGGKTTLSIIATVQNVDEKLSVSQAIILTASKQDSAKVHNLVTHLSAFTKINSFCVDEESELGNLKTYRGQIIIGMPENVLVFIRENNFRTETVNSLIIDSADLLLEKQYTAVIMRILYVLNGTTQVVMMVRAKTEAVQAFSKRLRTPMDIDVPPSEEAQDVIDIVDSPCSNDILEDPSPTAERTPMLHDGANSSMGVWSSEVIMMMPKYFFKVKSVKKRFTLVQVNAIANGEEIELELMDEVLSSFHRSEMVDPDEDPLALSESEAYCRQENELDPQEFARRLKSRDVLLRNPNLAVAFPEDFWTSFGPFLPKEILKKEETAQPAKVNKNNSCEIENHIENSLVDRSEFLKKKHFYVVINEEDAKIETLSLLNMEQERAIIFCSSCEKAEWLSTRLRQKSMFPQVLHKNTKKKDRKTILKTFEMEICRILISTDNVLNDVGSYAVPLVLNYDMPTIPVNYFWRSRFAAHNTLSPSRKSIMIVSFVQENDIRLVHHIEKTYGVKISAMADDSPPSRRSSVSSTVEVDLETPD